MTSITPENAPTLRNVGANQIYDARGINTSFGERKLRANLLDIFQTHFGDKNMDFLNQFFIAVSGGVETYENSKKTALLPGRVAVKIGVVGSAEGNAKYKYIFLNLNSLAKRLDLDKKIIKEAEAKGNLDQLIIKRVYELADEQVLIDEMIKGISNRQNAFAEGITEVTQDDVYLKEVGERPKVTKQEVMKKFIEEHFSDDEVLMGNLDEFLNDPVNMANAKDYLKHLVGKLWWHSDFHDQFGKVEKFAISSLPSSSNFVYGTAASRADNKGTREVTRVIFFDWDIDKRYALALEDDYVYTYPPTPRSKNEVPLELPQAEGSWVLVNKNSLKRLGIDNKTADEAVSGQDNYLREIVNLKIVSINDASTFIENTKYSLEKNNWMTPDDVELLDTFMKDYPDEKFKEITADFLKKYRGKEERIKQYAKGGEAKQEFIPIIEKLEENHLVRSKRKEVTQVQFEDPILISDDYGTPDGEIPEPYMSDTDSSEEGPGPSHTYKTESDSEEDDSSH